MSELSGRLPALAGCLECRRSPVLRGGPTGAPQPLLIAVTGPSGAGKSTLAHRWATLLGATIVHQDAFLLPAAEREGDSLLQKYDWGTFHEVLMHLLAHQPAGFSPFDAALRERRGWCTLAPRPMVPVEGITVLYCPLLQQTTSQAIYVDADSRLREQRQLARLDHEGQYRGVPAELMAVRIQAKKASEEPLVRAQRALCQRVIDTTPSLAGVASAAA
jgi:uridine kinase